MSLRNYEKRRDIRAQREALQKARSEEYDAVEEIDDDELYYSITNAIDKKYAPMIEYLIMLEFSLKYPETRNKWFCGIVTEKGVGSHRISEKQAYFFEQYFEADENTWKTHDVYCRAAGYFCRLHQWNGNRYLKIEKITKPE